MLTTASMVDKKEPASRAKPPLAIARQPVQLELFRLTEAQYTNAFEFYESIPRFIVGGDKARYLTPDGTIAGITRNPDGTALPIEKAYEYQGNGYTLAIKPALIKQKG